MQYYLPQIETGLIIFPFIAILITIPYIIGQYRKYGAVVMVRTLIIYSFIFYILCSYLLIILPLPPLNEVEQMVNIKPQLIPFSFVSNFIIKSEIIWNDPSTYLPALKSSSFLNVLFNIILFMPFGIYLRYYFKRSWSQVLLWAFILSLFFELSQLTGLYGLYPKAYRIFDVDDLITNTFGALFGCLVTPIFSLFMPSRDKIDDLSYQKGLIVSYTRRFFALMIDWSIIIVLVLTLDIFFNLSYLLPTNKYLIVYVFMVLITFVLIPSITKGYTLGKYIVRIRLSDHEGSTLKPFQYLFRYGLLYFVIIPSPASMFYLLSRLVEDHTLINTLLVLIILALSLFTIYLLIDSFTRLIRKEKILLYEVLTKTKNTSDAMTHDEL